MLSKENRKLNLCDTVVQENMLCCILDTVDNNENEFSYQITLKVVAVMVPKP